MACRLYLVGGTMGVGKSATCRELLSHLKAAVYLDGDWCWNADPFVVTPETRAMVIDNICHVLNNFLTCGAYTNVIFGWVMHRQEIIDTLESRLDLDDVEVIDVSLTCSPDELVARLTGDLDAGLRSPDIINRSLERLNLYPHLTTTLVDTTGMTPGEVARYIALL